MKLSKNGWANLEIYYESDGFWFKIGNKVISITCDGLIATNRNTSLVLGTKPANQNANYNSFLILM